MNGKCIFSIGVSLCVVFAAGLILTPAAVSAQETPVVTAAPRAGENAAATSREKTEAEESGDTSLSTKTDTTQGNGHVVCLDPGHQSSEIDMSEGEPDGPGSSAMKAKVTSGTRGAFTGIPEYALNLDVSLLLQDILEKRGYRVIMTRTDNETAISNSERALMAGEEGAEIFVRIHANGESSQQSSGALALCPSADNPYVASLHEESERLSTCILEAYCAATGFANLSVQTNDSMTGINWSTVPVTILEMGFMTNESDDKQMANVEFRQVMATGIADGIDAYFGIDTSAYEREAEASSESGDGARTAENSGTANSTAKADAARPAAKTDAAMKKLMAQLQTQLPRENGQWAVYVGNLSNGTAASAGSQPMQAASLIKLFIMGAVYEKYDTLADTYGADELDTRLHAMITVSDNDAANALTTYLGDGDSDAGMRAVTAYCTAHGYTDSHMGRLLLHSNEFDDNYTSVQDCGLFLTRVYNNSKHAQSDMPGAEAMFELLKQQTRTNKIPSRLPEGVHVANKTGELGDVENDVGIIFDTAKNTDLVICFMSQGLVSVGEAQSVIGELSEMIYRYYNE